MKLSKFLLVFAVVFSFSVQATDSRKEEYNYDLVDQYGSYNFSQTLDATKSSTTITIDGVDIKVGLTAWSDTWGHEDNYIQQAPITDWDGGLTVTNSQSGDSHYIDNFHGGGDFDMILLSFDTNVVLDSASFRSVHGDNGSNEVTIAGLADIALSNLSYKSTWADVAAFSISGTVGHYGISSSLESKFGAVSSAKYWLIGAYNTFFDDSVEKYKGVGFKLQALNLELGTTTTTPPTQVSEPGALALMGLGLGLVLYRRKRRV
ncbi:putative secreted protein with PEP-CTERM sorting signal [Alteromonas sp. I10]|uniref:exosortase-dependent surface protein XDP1 n=1 Tax=Alteromonas TaxID=226 RepID=UPI000D77246F|nr:MULTISPECIES: exosortase-dependent surface protein XDP1 [Alteromonas]PXW71354.1 putative secreted protein with PEP-CTERM sorting signal [Alteromonas sp. I10]